MAVFVVIVALCLALTVVQIDKFVARNQPLAILPPLANIYFANSKLLPLSQALHLFAELYHIHSEQVNDLLTTGIFNCCFCVSCVICSRI